MEAQAKPKRQQDPPGAAASGVVLPGGTSNDDADNTAETTTPASEEPNKTGRVSTRLSSSPDSTPTPSARAIEFLWDETTDFLEPGPRNRLFRRSGIAPITVPLGWAPGLREGVGFFITPVICQYHDGEERNCRPASKGSRRLTARQEGSPFDEVSFTPLGGGPYFLHLQWQENEEGIARGVTGESYSWLFDEFQGNEADLEGAIDDFVTRWNVSELPYIDKTGATRQENIFEGFEDIPPQLRQVMFDAATTIEDKQAKPTGSDVTLSPTSTLTDDVRDGKGSIETSRPSNAASKEDGGGGLSEGAIAGIGVAAGIVALAIVGFLVWFFCLRNRRRRSAKDHLRDGPYTAPADAQASEFMVSKETNGAHITESPHSPYSDDGSLANPQAAAAAYAQQQQQQQQQQQHHQYQPQQQPPLEQYSDAPPIAAPVPRSGSRQAAAAAEDRPVSRSGARSGTPGGNVSHLIEEGMTEADIRRLEEEERALDDAIERAGHGRRA